MPGRFEFQPNIDIGPGACAVFMARLDGISDIRADDALLSPEERIRCARFVQLADQNRFIAGRSMLRSVVSKVLEISPDALEFDLVNGKPILHKKHLSTLAFNLSHSGNRVCLAIVSKGSVGVDIERHNSQVDIDQVSRRVMSPMEIKQFDELEICDRTSVFFNLWAQKEAILKCIGSGFSIEPALLDLGLKTQASSKLVFNHQMFHLHSNFIEDNPDYAFAVASDNNIPHVQFYTVDNLLH